MPVLKVSAVIVNNKWKFNKSYKTIMGEHEEVGGTLDMPSLLQTVCDANLKCLSDMSKN